MKVNLVLQGKGGVGKSVIASFLTQHYRDHDIAPICVDTDPVNATFAGYSAFDVRRLVLMEDEDINQRAFDGLIEMIMTSDEPDAVMVVDNGAASFVPLGSYLAGNEAISVLTEAGHEVRLHTVLTGGQALEDTFKGLVSLSHTFPDTPIVVWMNEFFGPLSHNGVSLELSSEYKALAPRILAQITLPSVKMETFGHDLKQMLAARQTFAEAMASDRYSIMARQRLKMYWRKVGARIERAGL